MSATEFKLTYMHIVKIFLISLIFIWMDTSSILKMNKSCNILNYLLSIKWIVFSHQNIIVWFYILQCIIKHLNRKCSTFIKSYIFIRYQNNLTYFVFDLCSALSVVDVETCLKRIIIEHYRKITPYSIVIFPKALSLFSNPSFS